MFSFLLAWLCFTCLIGKAPFEFNQLVLQTPVILLLITLNGKMMAGEDQITTERIRISMLLALLGFIITKLV